MTNRDCRSEGRAVSGTCAVLLFQMFAISAAGGAAQTSSSEPRPSTPTQIAILGVYQPDRLAKDPLNPQRRADFQLALERLTAFQPTMIAVQGPFGKTSLVDRYQRFLTGGQQLVPFSDEVEELTFRLARQLGHQAIFPIDLQMRPYPDPLPELLERSPSNQAIYQQMIEYGTRLAEKQKNLLTEKSFLEFLIYLNSQEAISENHRFYADFIIRMGAEKSYAGADVIANWYKHNLKIFHNLHRITAGHSGQRVLTIIAQDHVKYLRDLIRESSHFEYIDILAILEGEAGIAGTESTTQQDGP